MEKLLLLIVIASLVCCFICLLQPEFWKVSETHLHRIPSDNMLCGFCYDDNKLYCVESRAEEGTHSLYYLTVYDITRGRDGNLRVLGSVKMTVSGVHRECRPRIDPQTHWVYVPCGDAGVRIFHWEGTRLQPVREPLACVETVRSVEFNTADTVFVCGSDSVCLVSVFTDTVIRRLQTPFARQHVPELEWMQRRKMTPIHVSVLGESVLVCYSDETLLTYHRDSRRVPQVLKTPEGLRSIVNTATDSITSSFLVTALDDLRRLCVYVLNKEGKVGHKIHLKEKYTSPMDCAVVGSELWVGYHRFISVMTS